MKRRRRDRIDRIQIDGELDMRFWATQTEAALASLR